MALTMQEWSRLAKAQLDGLRIKDSIGDYCTFDFLLLFGVNLMPIDSYIKAKDPSNFAEVIEIAEKHDDLVRHLQMRWVANCSANQELTLSWHARTQRLTSAFCLPFHPS
jgi:clathrin heavy chain